MRVVLLVALVPRAYSLTCRALPGLRVHTPVHSHVFAAATTSLAHLRCQEDSPDGPSEDAELAKRLQYEAALREAILEQQKPKPPNRAAVLALFAAVLISMGWAINLAFSPAADQFTGRLK